MKRYLETVFATTCYICGRTGWNPKAHEAWTGTLFYCRNGCDPADVKAKIEKEVNKVIEKQKKESEDNAV